MTLAEDIKEFFRQHGSRRYVACLQGLTEDVAKGILTETGGNTGRGSRLGTPWIVMGSVRSTPLMREKWNCERYREHTMERAREDGEPTPANLLVY